MAPIIGPILVTIISGVAIVLLFWIRYLTQTKMSLPASNVSGAHSLTAKAMKELLDDPPNFRSTVNVLRDNLIKSGENKVGNFLSDFERLPSVQIDAETFKSIYLSYFWSTRLSEATSK